MNSRSYKTVFSKRLGALVAVGEHATSQGKANGASGPGASGANDGAISALAGIGYVAALSASFAFVSLAWAAPATNALPTGGTVVQGAASMSQNANQLNIQQATQRAAINWQSFNIGAQAKVQVVQPNAQAVLLNRVVGQSPSQIFGQLQANGHVILVNPNGVLFGKDGSVNAGGFTASTLNISDANFMAGNMVYERNGSTAGIVNEGKISTEPGGYVALLGATVSNEGSITTKGGSVVMGAGETIKVPVNSTGRIKLELTAADMNANVSNTGSIITQGGQVYMQALALNRAAAQILQSGSIDTTGEKGGDVHVLADGGTIKVDGRITANSNNGTAGGDIYIGRDKDTNVLAAVGDVSKARLESQGGFVETSGEHLITTGTRVKAAEWLLDPTDITITNSVSGTPYTDPNATGGSYDYTAALTSLILASDIQASLNDGTSVTLATSSGGPDAGNITVATDISKTAGTEATLTLTAHNNIFLNAAISSTFDKLNINLNASGTGGISGNASGIINTNGGVFTLNTTNSNATGILRGNISGTGSVVKTGRGSTTLQGLNTFSGGLLISQGTIVLGNGGVATPDYNRAAGTGSITMGDNNTGTSNIALLLDRGISASQIGLSRDINVTNNGTGTVTLGGVSTATSGSGWTIFNSKINLEKSIIANDSTGDRISFDGQITGSGGITVTGNRLTMGASVQNTFTGDVNIVAGAHLQANSSNSLSKFNNVINHGRLSMWQGNGMTINALSGAGTVGLVFGSSPTNFIIGDNNGTGTFSGVISGPINLIKNGTGTQTFTGNNTYNGQTTVNKGVLSVKANAANATYGTPVYNVAAGATLNFDVANGVSTSAYQNTKFTGAGTITKTGSGTLAWAGSAATFEMAAGSLIDVQAGTFVGGSSTNENWTKNLSSLNVARSATFQGVEAAIRVDALTGEGKIQTGWNGIGGSITTGVNNHQTSGGSAIFSGVIENFPGHPVGKFIKEGTGTQILSGNNTYSGTTTVTGGTLQIGNAGTTGTLGAGAVILAGNANLKFVRSSHTIISNAISGTGNVSANITSDGGVAGNLIVDSTFNLDKGSGSSGLIDLRADGNVTLSKAIITTNQTGNAVKLIAGQALGAGTKTGGNVIVNNLGAITLGSGGIAALYTGSIDGTTGISVMSDSGSGKFRYNSDETQRNYTKSLNQSNGTINSGVSIIYREAPEIKVTSKSTVSGALTYNGLVRANPNADVTNNLAETGVLKNGDATSLTGTLGLAYQKGSETALKNAGTYTVKASGLTNELGYKVEYVDGSLVIDKANLTKVTASKTYDGLSTVKAIEITAIEGVNGEKFTANSGTAAISNKNVATAGKTLTSLSGLGLSGQTFAADISNYNLETGLPAAGSNNSVAIAVRPLTITVGTVTDKPADGTTTATVTPGALVNLVTGESLGVSATGNFSDANVGNGKLVTASYTLRNGVNGLASNYILNASTPNPDSRLRGNILASVNPVTPIAPVNNNTGANSRVRTVSGFSGAGAATGVLDDTPVTESREVCSDVSPENCECQPSVIPSIEICFAPKSVAATKEEK